MNRSASHARSTQATGILAGLKKLHEFKIGGKSTDPGKLKIPRKDLAYIIGNLATLTKNGLSLPKSLATLARERSLAKYASLLQKIQSKVESGESFSGALANYPATFSALVINQIQIGEKSGTIPETLARVTRQIERSSQLRSKVIKRLSYPMTVACVGGGVVTFMLIFVIPQFEEAYSSSNIPLPLVTRILIGVGYLAKYYGWILPVSFIASIFILRRMRRDDEIAWKMDRQLLRVPLLGEWLRDIAVLQFIEVLGIMMQSGFKLVDALSVAAGSIGNRAVRSAVEDLKAAVTRGERFSRELERHGELFPPVVSQLVIVGEQTGKLSSATADVTNHLQLQVERKADTLVSTLEPILTIGLAICIGIILLAIYTPMFGMIDTIES